MLRLALLGLGIYLVSCGFSRLLAQDVVPKLVTSFPATNGQVYAVALDEPNNTAYIGGSFTTIGGQSRINLAAINVLTGAVTAWNPPAPDGSVRGLAAIGNRIYVGGTFEKIGNTSLKSLAALNKASGEIDNLFGTTTNGTVQVILRDGGDFYLGGDFERIDNIALNQRNGIGLIVGTSGTLSPFNPGTFRANPSRHGIVDALFLSGEHLYLAGDFARMQHALDGPERKGLAAVRRGTGELSALNLDQDGRIRAVAVLPGDAVYIGGSFGTVNGVSRNRLARIDAALSGGSLPVGTLNSSFNANVQGGDVQGLAISTNTLYLAGTFTTVNGSARKGLAAVDTNLGNLNEFDPSLLDFSSESVTRLQTVAGGLFVYGTFLQVSGETRRGLAVFSLPPRIDLNGPNEDGVNFATSYEVGEPAVRVVGLNASIEDVFLGKIDRVQVRIQNVMDSGSELLTAQTGGGLSTNYDKNSGTLTISGSAGLNEYMQALRSVNYRNVASPALATEGVRHIRFTVNDGRQDGVPATATVSVNAINTYVVTTRQDIVDGVPAPGSLRAHLLNATPGDTIRFDPTVFDLAEDYANNTIVLNQELPALAQSKITLDGSDVRVLLQAQSGFNGLVILSSNNNVRGLAITGAKNGILIDGQNGPAVANTLGGSRNVNEGLKLFGNALNGISLRGSGVRNTLVRGCYIGLSDLDHSAAGNAVGISISAGANLNLIGAERSEQANIIGHNTTAGIALSDAGTVENTIQGNAIGIIPQSALFTGRIVDSSFEPRPNKNGIFITNGATNTRIGGIKAGQGNEIGYNEANGVLVEGAGTIGHRIQGNSISQNGEDGIVLKAGGNKEIMAPEIAAIRIVRQLAPTRLELEVSGTATHADGSSIEVFADNSSAGAQGNRLLGTTKLKSKKWTSKVEANPVTDAFITVNCTDKTGNTSAFSRRALLTGAPIFTSDNEASGMVGTAFNYVPTADGTMPIVFAMNGFLPVGLSFDVATQRIVGTPQEAGSFLVMLQASNNVGTTIFPLSVSIAVKPALDSDGDGVSDELEVLLGTLPDDPTSTPLPENAMPETAALTALTIRQNFKQELRDRLTLIGSLPVTNGFSFEQIEVAIFVGGYFRRFTLDLKGIAASEDKTERLQLKVKLKNKTVVAGDTRMSLKVSKADLRAHFLDEGISSQDVTPDKGSTNRNVEIAILFNNRLFTKNVPLIYKARRGISGLAKSPKPPF